MAHRRRRKEAQVNFPRRGEIYLVAFDLSMGREIKKTRPALVLQNDISNRYSTLTIVAAISSQFGTPPHPREVIIETSESGLPKTSAVVMSQIRSVDRLRLIRWLGKLGPESMHRVDRALMISLGLMEL